MVAESDVTINTAPTRTLVGQSGVGSISPGQYVPTSIANIPPSFTSLPSPATSETIAVNAPMISPVQYNAATSVQYNVAGGVGAATALHNPAPTLANLRVGRFSQASN